MCGSTNPRATRGVPARASPRSRELRHDGDARVVARALDASNGRATHAGPRGERGLTPRPRGPIPLTRCPNRRVTVVIAGAGYGWRRWRMRHMRHHSCTTRTITTVLLTSRARLTHRPPLSANMDETVTPWKFSVE